MNLSQYIAQIPDFPKSGILFYDISPLLGNGPAWKYTIQTLANNIQDAKPDIIVGIESRGFLLAAPLAYHLGIGFVMIRKSGKLPGETLHQRYGLEYSQAELEMQKNAIQPEQRIVVVDDVLATGGTIGAAIQLLNSVKADVVHAAFLIELAALRGREKLSTPITSLLTY